MIYQGTQKFTRAWARMVPGVATPLVTFVMFWDFFFFSQGVPLEDTHKYCAPQRKFCIMTLSYFTMQQLLAQEC